MTEDTQDLKEVPKNPVPGLTPPEEKNPENALYQAWAAAEEAARPDIEHRLLQHLRRHATKVCWMVLHSNQAHIIEDICQDAIMKLGTFQGRSSFATWFHACALNKCRMELRRLRQRKEVSLDALNGHLSSRGRPESLETRIIVNDLLSNLTDFERQLVDLKVAQNLSDKEIAAMTGKNREQIQILWARLRKDLKEKYNGDGKSLQPLSRRR